VEWFLGLVAGWAERLLGVRSRRHATDTRIADKAKVLRRQLAASVPDRPDSPVGLDDLTTWAGKLAAGFGVTEPAVRELVDLRPDASARVRRAVGPVRDEYYAAADVVNRLFAGGGLSITAENRPQVATRLMAAADHMRKCLLTLAWIDGERRD
jgi:hypothetical protein